MHKTDFEAFSGMWEAVHGMYSQKPLNDMAITLAFRTLARFELADVQRAVESHLNDTDAGRFMPKPADIVAQIEGDSETKAMLAWTKYHDALQRVGTYESVVFDDPLIMAICEDMGGWCHFGKSLEKDIPFIRNEFVKRYRGYTKNPPASYPPKLTGITEAQNSANYPQHVNPPLLIGDQSKAQHILESGQKRKALIQPAKMIENITKELTNDQSL